MEQSVFPDLAIHMQVNGMYYSVFLKEDQVSPCALFWEHKDFVKMATMCRAFLSHLNHNVPKVTETFKVYGCLCGYYDVHFFEMVESEWLCEQITDMRPERWGSLSSHPYWFLYFCHRGRKKGCSCYY